jgi:CDP-glucose 4,6-dehydratase
MKIDEFYRNKKILVTGNTGFMGSWLTKMLLNLNSKVYGLSLRPITNPNMFNAVGLNKIITTYFYDIRNKNNVFKVVKQTKPEIIFHLAAQPLVLQGYNDPITTFTTNFIGTINLLEAVRRTPSIKACVIITTDKVYKNTKKKNGYVENDTIWGNDPYSASKACVEIAVNAYEKSYFNNFVTNVSGTSIATARVGNIIGGGDWSENRLIPDVMRSVFNNYNKLEIRMPNAIRPWQHVLDPLYGYLILAQKLYTNKQIFSGPWNFGPKKDNFINVNELVNRVYNKLGSKKTISIKNSSKPETEMLKLDSRKAERLLGFTSALGIEDTLNLTIEWYEAFYKNNDVSALTDKQINYYKNKILDF